jgi:hypothetical protein
MSDASRRSVNVAARVAKLYRVDRVNSSEFQESLQISVVFLAAGHIAYRRQ